MNWTEIALIGAFIVREIFFQREIHKLLEKLMSRDLYDYKTAHNVGKHIPQRTAAANIAMGEDPEDLGVLQSLL